MRKIYIIVLVFIICLNISSANAVPINKDTTALAEALHCFGLFAGTGVTSDGKPIFSLEKEPTRQEAIVILIGLLGKKEEAINCTYQHPFNDVDLWADRYIAYAYENNLTSGVDEYNFGSNQKINAQQYITFLLKALGYKNFSYDEVFAFSDSIGLTDGVYMQGDSFLRSDVVWLSCNALLQPINSTNIPLIKQLKKDGILTKDQYINGLYIMEVTELKENFRYVTLNSIENTQNLIIDVYNLYAENAYGEYEGYKRLKGYGYDNIYPIYFIGDYSNNIRSLMCSVETSKNMDEICYWNYNGKNYKNKRRECYKFFEDTGYFRNYYDKDMMFNTGISTELTTEWFFNTFGEVFDDWCEFREFCDDATTLVDRYLNMQEGIFYLEPSEGLQPEIYFGLFDFEESWREYKLDDGWASEYELQQLSENDKLRFGIMMNIYFEYSNTVYGFLNDSEELVYIYDMPESFAQSTDNISSMYNEINFKKENGELYFFIPDLIKLGLLKNDGIYNENFKPQVYINNSIPQEWIDEDELNAKYSCSAIWMGDYIYINNYSNNQKYKITGVPNQKLETNVIYTGKYNKDTIHFQYSNNKLLFNYYDLCSSNIIN